MEVMVALGLLTVVMVASLPVLFSVLRSAVTTRMETQGKNLAQERLEQVRNLRYHVDRQNGPFLDLLDIYYTNATPSAPASTVTAAGDDLVGKYIPAGSGTDGEPVGPYYRTETGPLPGAEDFSQRVLMQFLSADGTPVPAERFEDSYDSQLVGSDRPPSLLVGVTVITEWIDGGDDRSFSTYTRLTDGRPQLPLIQSQLRAVALEVTSTGVDGATLQLQGGVVSLDGAQSSGSSVTGYAVGAVAKRTGFADVVGETSSFSLPGTTPTTTGSSAAQVGLSCSWFGFGATDTMNVTGDVTSGLPKAPLDVDTAGVVGAAVLNSGSPTCGQMSYDNTAGGGVADTELGELFGAAPWVRVAEGSGGSPGVRSSGFVDATDPADGTETSSGGSASMDRAAVLFPHYPHSSGQGLVSVRLDESALTCASGVDDALGEVTGTYTLTLGWWGTSDDPADETDPVAAPSWHTAVWKYDSASGNEPVLQSGSDTWEPTATFLDDGRPLSDLVTGGAAPGVVATGDTNGLRGFLDGIFSLTTAPTLEVEASPGFSAINVTVGRLTCVADDHR
jgi:type II secretory pathway pseudopilin PulG